MGGNVARPGKYALPADSTIEEAFVLAGGWAGKGGLSPDDGTPPRHFMLFQAGAPKADKTKVRIEVNRETKAVKVIAQEWSVYRLRDHDVLEMPVILW